MSSVEPKYRRPLNTEQVEILELLYKFRFGTVQLCKDYFSESNPGMDVFRRLLVLEDRGFIIRQYLPDYKLQHKPVVYCLLPEGARKLVRHRDPDDKHVNIRAVYKNKDVLEPFILHCLALKQECAS